jgi:hypothetical protein
VLSNAAPWTATRATPRRESAGIAVDNVGAAHGNLSMRQSVAGHMTRFAKYHGARGTGCRMRDRRRDQPAPAARHPTITNAVTAKLIRELQHAHDVECHASRLGVTAAAMPWRS